MSSYVYNASALGLGGVLTSGNNRTVIPSIASVALSPSGGEGSVTAESYNANGIAFDRATSHVVGAEVTPGVFQTYAEVFISNFRVSDAFNFPRLRIASMSAQVTSTRNLTSNESQFYVLTTFSGINLDCMYIEPLIDENLTNAHTFGEVVNTLSGDVEDYENRFALEPGVLQQALATNNGLVPLSGTLVRDWSRDLPCHGRALKIPRLGRVHFAEFIFKPGRRRINLLRVEVNPTEGSEGVLEGGGNGDVTGGTVEGNGSPPM